MRITELDIFAPETVFVRMADKSYYKVDFRRHQFTAGLSDGGAFFKAEPLDPQVAKKLGLDGYLDDKYQGRKQELPGARRYHPWAVNDPKTIAPGQSIQQGGPFGDRRVTVVDFTNPQTMRDLPSNVKSKLTKAVQQAEKTSEAKEQKPIKARDPNWRDMEALRKSGAAGSHGDKTKTIPRKEKYKKISMEDQFQAYMQENDMSTGVVAVGKKGKTRRATGINDNPYDHNEGEDQTALVNAALWNMKDVYQTIMAGESLSEDDMFSYGDLVQYLEQADMPDHYSKFWDLVVDAINKAGGFAGQGSELQVDKNIAPQIKTLYQQFKADTAKVKGVKEADPDTLGKMNDKMRDVLSKVDTDDKAKVQAAKDKAEAERQAKMKELGPDAMDKYIDMLKKHDWTYNYSDDHRYYVKGSEEEKAIRALGDIVDPDRKLYKQYSPFYEAIANERSLTKGEEKDKEKYVKGMKKNKKDFKKRYGDDAEAVMYATATKMAKESSDIFKALQQVDETATAGATSAGNIATVASPHIAIGDKKTRKKYGLTGGLPNPPKAKAQKPTDNALNMKGTSIFGGPLKRS